VYELTVESRFAAAHQLRNYRGRCENLHGHNWKVQATLTAGKLNPIGLALDFKEMKGALREVLSELDHHFLNELPMFQSRNPSSENLARWIFERLTGSLNREEIRVSRVTVWESSEACAAYIPDDDA